ncbi:hypothetical protein FD754_011959, partial [Muntiacus muntjak]
VLLKTTAGDIDIELWSKEAPKACRNFIQLCLEAYYDNTIFHRVVPGFIVQGGDPTGTGTGGESVYGAPFKDEFHSRLRFNRRGLVAMANAGPHDNGSQFFFTLGRADELNNKHTIFGKVTGDTVYNMLRLTEVDIDDEERPRNPHKIRSCEVLFNPFDDIIPREIKKPKKEKPEEEVKKLKPKGTKNFSLLSFGEEAEEEEEEVNRVSQSMKGKSKSSHDLLKDDPHLSSVPAVESEKGDAAEDSDDDGEYEGAEHDEYVDGDERNQMRERIAKKLKKDTSENVKTAGESDVEKKSVSRRSQVIIQNKKMSSDLGEFLRSQVRWSGTHISLRIFHNGRIFPFLFCLSLFFSAICRAFSDNHFAFLHFFFLGSKYKTCIYNCSSLSPSFQYSHPPFSLLYLPSCTLQREMKEK